MTAGESGHFEGSCRDILQTAFRGITREAAVLRGVDEDDDPLFAGIAGRSERHVQATIFSALRRRGYTVSVEDGYHGGQTKKRAITADLAIRLPRSLHTWLWTELKVVLPGNLGFAARGVVRSDLAKLERVAIASSRNLPQALMLVLIRNTRSKEMPVDWHWRSLLTLPALAGWSFSEHRIAAVEFGAAHRGEFMLAMWARETQADRVSTVRSQEA